GGRPGVRHSGSLSHRSRKPKTGDRCDRASSCPGEICPRQRPTLRRRRPAVPVTCHAVSWTGWERLYKPFDQRLIFLPRRLLALLRLPERLERQPDQLLVGDLDRRQVIRAGHDEAPAAGQPGELAGLVRQDARILLASGVGDGLGAQEGRVALEI